jgi:hypothetical protein
VIPIVRTYLTAPILPPVNGVLELDPYKIVNQVILTFRVAESGYSMFPVLNPVHLYHYRCESCNYASGALGLVFRTTSASAKEMQDGPTEEQQEQMNDHSRQHEIMLAWVRGLEKQ